MFHRVRDLGSGHPDSEAVHGLLEFDPVLPTLDRVELHADDLNAEALQNACLRKLGTEVEARLAAQVREQRVRPLFFDDLCKPLHVERFDIGNVCHLRVRHDRRRIRVDENDPVSEPAKRLACLRSGVIKFTGLSDNDRTGSYNQNTVDVFPFHLPLPF